MNVIAQMKLTARSQWILHFCLSAIAQLLKQTRNTLTAVVIGFSDRIGVHHGVKMVTLDYASIGTDLKTTSVHAMSSFILISLMWASKIMEIDFLRSNLIENSN